MYVTKYPQSCLLIEEADTRIVIDPGELFSADYKRGDLGEVDAVFYTHIHPDHLDHDLAEIFIEEEIPLYGNQSVVDELGGVAKLLDDGELEVVGEIEVEAYDLPHCVLVNGQPGPQNTGFVINGFLFHPGDGVSIDGLEVENVALPIAGPSISPKTAFEFAQQVGAKVVIPIHFENWKEDPDIIKSNFDSDDLQVHVLDNGEMLEL